MKLCCNKKYYLNILILVLTISLFSINSYALQTNNALDLIRKDLDNKSISLDEYVLLVIQTIKEPSALPSEYKSTSLTASYSPGRCATTELIYIRNNWTLLSASTQSTFSAAMLRATTTFIYDSPGGFFKLHYDTSGSDAVSPIDNDFNGIPDYIDRCASYMDSSLTTHNDLGYLNPPPDFGQGGDDKYDVYFESMGFYGYMQPETEGPEPWFDYTSYIVLHNTYIGFPDNSDPEGNVAGAAKVTAAHEFHHAVQMAYYGGADIWILESDAVYMEDIVFDQVDDNYNYMSSFFYQPHVTILENSSHAYSCFVWEMFLAEHFDTSFCVAIWEGARYNNLFETINDTLVGRYGWTLDSAFAEFANWNYCTDNRDDGLHYSEGDSYLSASVNRTHSGYPTGSVSPAIFPQGYGASYIRFYPDDPGILHISFNGNDATEWSANIIKSTSINNHEFMKIELDPVSKSGNITIENFENYYSVTLVGVNLSEFTGSATFSYSAEVSIPFAVSNALASFDTLIYSGDNHKLDIQVTNNSFNNDIISLMAWDDFGWVVDDSQDVALESGQDSILQVEIGIPQGTPLGQISNLYFKVVSWGDPLVTDSITTRVTSILQRGDSDFSGQIGISDLTYMVEYLFNSGPVPIPISDAGDFNCSLELGISDLTGIVNYLFESGPPPPCNPY